MLSILWRLVAIAVLLPFVMFPFLNFVAIPLELYLVFSLAAIIWRRVNRSSLPAERGAL